MSTSTSPVLRVPPGVGKMERDRLLVLVVIAKTVSTLIVTGATAPDSAAEAERQSKRISKILVARNAAIIMITHALTLYKLLASLEVWG